ncbi:hypothetical protein [Fusobacterium sp.]|uniref:hypothetical protein n=1 Tax=Fusobacterium sp. TaxID=68766 RepID=UPI002903D1A3|nr:hypothetical protein [Fusobacterium sp.]MDU1911908.1 hypothetical protein [Fusobacterium sp.]
MDTIEIVIGLQEGITLEEIGILQNSFNNLRSTYGYTYCDVLQMTKNGSLAVKISYPRFFKGINAYLISTRRECFEVQKHLIEYIMNDPYLKTLIKDINLTRVDIPFTYYMGEEESFHNHQNIFMIFAQVYQIKKPKSSTKGIIDIVSKEQETLTYADTKSISSYNSKLVIYDQYKNILSKTEDDMMKDITANYPDLRKRIRFEVSKRIRRKSLNLEEFKSFDIYLSYFEEYKGYILDNVLDIEIIEMLYKEASVRLAQILYSERALGNFNYEVFILKNLSKIYDYEILRRALNIEIENTSTRENAVTKVRKILNDYQESTGIIVLDTYKHIIEMRNNFIKYSIVDKNENIFL